MAAQSAIAIVDDDDTRTGFSMLRGGKKSGRAGGESAQFPHGGVAAGVAGACMCVLVQCLWCSAYARTGRRTSTHPVDDKGHGRSVDCHLHAVRL